MSAVRAVVLRVDRRGLAVAIPLAVVACSGIVMLEEDVWHNSVDIIAGRMVHTTVTALVVLAGVLVADEAVGRGMRPLPAYTLAIVAASMIGSFLGHEVRVAVRLPDDDPPITPRFPQMRRFEVASIAMFLASLATIAHLSRRNALAARRRQAEAEAARARAQRRSLESELQALQPRIEPAFLCVATSTAALHAGAGDALQSLADRLGALYGDRADVRFEATADGSLAELEIPLESRTEGFLP